MAVAIIKQHNYTAEELYEICQAGERYELVRGELREMPPAGEEHGFRGGRLFGHFSHYVLTNGLGEVSLAETGFVLSRNPDTVRAPDMAFIRRARLPQQFSVRFSEIIPDLVMEVVSPNDSWSEVTEKVQQWLAAGVRVVWVMDPKARTVTVCRESPPYQVLSESDTLDGGDIVPGFPLPVATLFT